MAISAHWKVKRELCLIDISMHAAAIPMVIVVLPLNITQILQPELFRNFTCCSLLNITKATILIITFLHILVNNVFQLIYLIYPLRATAIVTNRKLKVSIAAAWIIPMLIAVFAVTAMQVGHNGKSEDSVHSCSFSELPIVILYLFTYPTALATLLINLVGGFYFSYAYRKHIRKVSPMNSTFVSATAEQPTVKPNVSISILLGMIIILVHGSHIYVIAVGILSLHFRSIVTERFDVIWTTVVFIVEPLLYLAPVLLHVTLRKHVISRIRNVFKCVQ